MGAEVALAAGVIGAGAQAYGAYKDTQDLKGARREARAARDDLSYRREATYRQERDKINTVLSSYYKSKGWEMPKEIPGQYTAVGLPGEKPLYPKEQQGVEDFPDATIKESSGAFDDEASQIVNAANDLVEVDAADEAPVQTSQQQPTQQQVPATQQVGANASGGINTPGGNVAYTPKNYVTKPLVEDEDEALKIINALKG